jgi:hypothetical protein
MNNDIVLINKDEQQNIWEFAVRLSKSKMVPAIFQGKVEDVFVTVIMGRELGLAPIMALQAICVIQGTVTLKVQTMNAIVRAKCPDAIIEIKLDHEKKQARVTAKRNKDDLGYESYWDMDMARQMGLAGKDNWIKQAMNMLKARALSDALRAVFPDVLLGLYSTEEMSDIEPRDPPREVKSETMSATLRREVDEDFPIPAEEKVVGPLYRIQHGTTMGGKQLKDFSIEELESYSSDLKKRKTKLYWMNDLINVIDTYVSNFEMYREMVEELNEDSEMVQV